MSNNRCHSSQTIPTYVIITRPFSSRFCDDDPLQIIGAENGLLQLDILHAEKSHGEGFHGVIPFRDENHAMRRQISAALLGALRDNWGWRWEMMGGWGLERMTALEIGDRSQQESRT